MIRWYWLAFLLLFAASPSHAQKKSAAAGELENLGPLIESSTLDGKFMFRTADGHTHVVLYYSGLNPIQILHVDLDTGAARVLDSVAGRPAPNGTVLLSNGKLYMPSGDPGYLFEYDPTTGESKSIGKLADKGGQWAVEGDDEALYIGETVKGYVERYDPQTGKLESLGIMDDPGPPYYRYAYTVGSDGRFVYAGMGQQPWYLVIYDLATGSQKSYWKDMQPREVTVAKGVNGGWYVTRCATEEDGQYRCRPFRLQDGEPVALQPGEKVQAVPYASRGNVLNDFAQAPALFGYEIDLADALPDTGNQGYATLRWRAVGQQDWSEAGGTVKMFPFNLKRVLPYSSDELLAASDFYGPIVAYNPQSRETRLLGRPQASIYAALPSDDQWYFSGYPAITLRYDPAKPWTLTASTPNPRFLTVNPYQLPGIAKYHYYLARGADGFIYVGVHHERDSVGGELGWYDPATDKLDRLRSPFEKLDVRDLIAVDGGNKIVYSSIAIETGIDAKLFVFDTATKSIEREIAIEPGLAAYDKLVETSPGIVFGILGDRCFSVNVLTGEILFVKPLGGLAFPTARSYDRRPALGPDGYVWLVIGDTLARVNPADGAVTKLLKVPPISGVTFLGNDIFLYGIQSLYRVSGIGQPDTVGAIAAAAKPKAVRRAVPKK